ncbi:inositol hexakisphosphate and diphosphoinositol-pentakisphosphate kinase 2 [Plakobranchus ocellatus]|uniref:Inositol hexakisphosphate and diphosphoinositol-pentakisphosphate kinase 2 n=1 Tax=Plakobranchus ocellatus TaxID=259542 RepID=A0AAV4DL06_9GAST|nr:inositol hexakisphosphate and diphosphoinositol-pentakisphosphate kinase 2 [Plakobranchus ocellatus]
MGSFDGAETCELVGLYLLSQLKNLNINIGLYRDDGLAVTTQSARGAESTKKKICKIFKDNGLNITIEANKKAVDFLDISFDLRTGTCKPYKKPNANIDYINKESNHPPSIKRNLAKAIAIRLSNNSSNAEIFHQAAEKYQEALTCSGYQQQLRYTPSHQTPPHAGAPRASMNLKNNSQSGATTNTINYQETPNTNKVYLRRNNARARRTTWFNPPYSMNVATNIGKKFLTLINTCFPKTNILLKVINRNTIKISYSCMPNVKSIITAHNKSVLAQKNTRAESTAQCNCRDRKACPLENNCLQDSIIYQATVTQKDNQIDTYIGMTENTFKTRFYQHNSTFRLPHKRNSTSLSEKIWKLKDTNTEFTITWDIIAKSRPCSPATKICSLCLEERYQILTRRPSLNKKKNEFLSTCPHRRKYLLQNMKPP